MRPFRTRSRMLDLAPQDLRVLGAAPRSLNRATIPWPHLPLETAPAADARGQRHSTIRAFVPAARHRALPEDRRWLGAAPRLPSHFAPPRTERPATHVGSLDDAQVDNAARCTGPDSGGTHFDGRDLMTSFRLLPLYLQAPPRGTAHHSPPRSPHHRRLVAWKDLADS
jgi:hypothetical protein